jgi:ABC-2 type transport system ATP-binding protein/lipopolysaccharide transport system ATP-binding protein
MNPENIIEFRDVSMRYRVYKSRRKTLRESIFRTILKRDEAVDVWALKDVSFSVKRGDSLGVIGNNGAGKSTLCLLLSQIMAPTGGVAEIAGKVSALLSIGAGFQTDLSGRDNVMLNGIFMGHKRDEIQEKFKEIVDFAELWDFIDMPVRTYSSGMRARLAFSIATSVLPEILIIDELMGVGDRNFQEKSAARMRELVEHSQALVVVSHSMLTIKSLCSRAVWLEKGKLMANGPVEEVVESYKAKCAQER